MDNQASNQAIKNSNHKLKKSLGQNFINDINIIDGIIDCIDFNNVDGIIEIGPGIGALTQGLIETNLPVVSVELDDDLIPILTDKFGSYDNFKLVHQDFLKLNPDELYNNFDKDANLIVVANIPYYITTPIITKLIEEYHQVSCSYLMVQKEVAQRICATDHNKKYGSLSVYCQALNDCNIEFIVDKKYFKPIPKVDSAIISLRRKENEIDNLENFSDFLLDCFSLKRKTLINSLANASGISKELITNFVVSNNLTTNTRAEEIDVQTFIMLYNSFNNWKENNYE